MRKTCETSLLTDLVQVNYYLITCLTYILNHNFLTRAKAEIKDLTICIVVNGEKF